jgi:hypothetical protein
MFNTSERLFTAFSPAEQSYFLQDTFAKVAAVYFDVNARYTISYLNQSLVNGGVEAKILSEDIMNVTISFAPYTVTRRDTIVVVDTIVDTPLVVYTDALSSGIGTNSTGSSQQPGRRDVDLATEFTSTDCSYFFGTDSPTSAPTRLPTAAPTNSPSAAPTSSPTAAPTRFSCVNYGFNFSLNAENATAEPIGTVQELATVSSYYEGINVTDCQQKLSLMILTAALKTVVTDVQSGDANTTVIMKLLLNVLNVLSTTARSPTFTLYYANTSRTTVDNALALALMVANLEANATGRISTLHEQSNNGTIALFAVGYGVGIVTPSTNETITFEDNTSAVHVTYDWLEWWQEVR